MYNYCEDDGSVTPNSALQVTCLTLVSMCAVIEQVIAMSVLILLGCPATVIVEIL